MTIVSPNDPIFTTVPDYKLLMDYLKWPVVFRDANGVLRFKGKSVPLLIQKFTGYKIFHELVLAYYRKEITLDEWMQFYIDTEVSLSAFLDVFERRIWPEDEQEDEDK